MPNETEKRLRQLEAENLRLRAEKTQEMKEKSQKLLAKNQEFKAKNQQLEAEILRLRNEKKDQLEAQKQELGSQITGLKEEIKLLKAKEEEKPSAIEITEDGENGEYLITAIFKGTQGTVKAGYLVFENGLKVTDPSRFSYANGILVFRVSFCEPFLKLKISALDSHNNVATEEPITLIGPMAAHN